MATKRITFVLCKQMLATSVALPMEQLRAAESMARARKLAGDHRLEIVLASLDGKPVQTHTGMKLHADASILELEGSDITYLPALWRHPEPIIKSHKALLPWLAKLNEAQSTIAGVGTGCCFLAEAGLLDGQAATTHWYYFDRFEQLYPKVKLKRDFFITRAQNLYCTGSVTSLADLTVFFIQNLYDATIAHTVERHFFHQVRQAYARSFDPANNSEAHPDEVIAELQSWMRENSHEDVNMQELAKSKQLSLRSFNRRFKEATNSTPLQYLQSIRMRNARELLQTSNLSIAETAYRCGYQDQAHFTSLFKKHFGTTPGQYKTTVRAKLFSIE